MGQREVADRCHRKVPEYVLDSSSAQVVLDAQVH